MRLKFLPKFLSIHNFLWKLFLCFSCVCFMGGSTLSYAKNINFTQASKKGSKIFVGFNVPRLTSEDSDNMQTLLVSFGHKKPTLMFIVPYDNLDNLPSIGELIKKDLEICFSPSYSLKFYITDSVTITCYSLLSKKTLQKWEGGIKIACDIVIRPFEGPLGLYASCILPLAKIDLNNEWDNVVSQDQNKFSVYVGIIFG